MIRCALIRTRSMEADRYYYLTKSKIVGTFVLLMFKTSGQAHDADWWHFLVVAMPR